MIGNNSADVLDKLADPGLDVFNSVALDNSGLSNSQRTFISKINAQPAARVQEASIASYRSQEVIVRASLANDGILVLNDTDYPGWSAEIDGRLVQSINANYMFRAVLLPAGSHVVRFVYRPHSLYKGLAIALMTLAIVVAGGVLTRSRRDRIANKEPAVFTTSS